MYRFGPQLRDRLGGDRCLASGAIAHVDRGRDYFVGLGLSGPRSPPGREIVHLYGLRQANADDGGDDHNDDGGAFKRLKEALPRHGGGGPRHDGPYNPSGRPMILTTNGIRRGGESRERDGER